MIIQIIKLAVIFLLTTNSYAEFRNISDFEPTVRNSNTIDMAKSTLKLISENKESLIRYGDRTETFIIQTIPQVSINSHVERGRFSLYIRLSTFDVKYDVNSVLFAIYIDSRREYLYEKSWFVNEHKQFEPIINDMLLKYREHLNKEIGKFANEQTQIKNYFNKSQK